MQTENFLLSLFLDEKKERVCDSSNEIDDVNIHSLFDMSKIENLSLKSLMKYQNSITLPVSIVFGLNHLLTQNILQSLLLNLSL